MSEKCFYGASIRQVAGMPLYRRHVWRLCARNAVHLVTKVKQGLKRLPPHKAIGSCYENDLIRHNLAIACRGRRLRTVCVAI